VSQTDFNDLHVTAGLDVVREQVLAGIKAGGGINIVKTYFGLEIDDAPPNTGEGAHTPGNAARGGTQWRKRFARNRKGGVLGWVSNVVLVLTHDERWFDALGYCDFSYRVIKHRETIPGCRPGEWEDADTARLKDWLGRVYCFNPSRSEVIDAVIVAAQQKRFHPVKDYLAALEWDQEPRLAHWLSDALGATTEAGNTKYLALAGCKFLIGAVARVMRPPVKMDNVLILEGRQGRGKSTVVSILFGDWYSDAPLQLGDKDAYQNIQGVWGIEMAELDSFNKAESTTAKMFFSQIRDRYRPSYGHMSQDFPRQCVFVGTTNQDEYLKDYTGNRRYWPVKCLDINAQWVRDNRDQLWAEAMHGFNAGDVWWPEGDDETRLFAREQDSRLQLDPWHYPIEDYLRSSTYEHVTADEVITEAIKKDHAHVTRADQNRLAPILKALGWSKKRISIQGRQRHGYARPVSWKITKPDIDDDDYGLPDD